MLAMPESMGWFFLLFYLSCQSLVFGLYAFSGVRDAISMESLSVACVLGGVGVAVAFGQLRHLLSLAMQMQTLAQLAPVQIRRFNVATAGCACCHLQHVHPLTGSTLSCDFLEVCSLVEEASSAKGQGYGLQLFNMRVREQAATLLRCWAALVCRRDWIKRCCATTAGDGCCDDDDDDNDHDDDEIVSSGERKKSEENEEKA